MSTRWFSESLYPDFKQSFSISEIVYEGRTEFQDIIIFQTQRFGRVLALDGIIQTTEVDEFCYHEMIAHIPLVAHGACKKVLIIGGGDGGTLREVLKHPIEKAVVVELDKTVIEICMRHLPSLSGGAFDNPKTDLRILDGLTYVRETHEKFDIIIIDSTDPIGPGKALFSEIFYRNCSKCLNENGILVTQSGVTWMQSDVARKTFENLNNIFLDADFFLAQVPTYGAGFMTFGWGSNNKISKMISRNELERRMSKLNLNTKYYNSSVHRGAFFLPGYIEALKNIR